MTPRVRGPLALGIAAGVLVATLLTGAAVGAVPVPLGLLLRPQDPAAAILIQVRLPRVLLGAVTGMSLALAGAAFQGLFRNPMADPSVVGVSAGASLGATLVLTLAGKSPGLVPLASVPAAAFLGGLLAVWTVWRLAAAGGRVPILGLLLAGVAVGSLAMAIVSLLILSDPDRAGEIVFWLVGSLSAASWKKVAVAAPWSAAGLFVLLAHRRQLNAFLLGEETAHLLGVEVEAAKRWIFLAGSGLVAAAVAFTGNIAFVGLVVPHATRLLVGPDHRYLLPVASLLGGAALVAADTLARTLAAPAELPVGVIMSLAGTPVFLYLVRRRLQPATSL
ncbi:FecCD family ABC transporter permease [Caldinitratiruptor microaerophilus]|uniref:FecCD family ABC transporter permease n=1 Tax=Caldinitratiruptor microaerophilus TaxID=671077 RepID=UPI00222F720C|nr:iron ABC transporter permease [Caldinitratiruptor microaerophilus]